MDHEDDTSAFMETDQLGLNGKNGQASIT